MLILFRQVSLQFNNPLFFHTRVKLSLLQTLVLDRITLAEARIDLVLSLGLDMSELVTRQSARQSGLQIVLRLYGPRVLVREVALQVIITRGNLIEITLLHLV